MSLYSPDKSSNNLYIDQQWALFVGHLNDNVIHRHYALQINIITNGDIKITDQKHHQKSPIRSFISSNISHQLLCNGICLIILINPLSDLGHQLFKKYSRNEIVDLGEDFSRLSHFFMEYLQGNLNFNELTENVTSYLEQFIGNCKSENHFSDERIYRALQYLDQHFERIVPLEEISRFCHLSQTRFLHLFKEKTNLNFRRYQLWNKLIKSIPYLKEHTITETAHRFGFTDSSHYTRTFKETFGLSPKILKSLK